MRPPASRYKLPSRFSDRAVVDAIRDRWMVKGVETAKSHRTYLDTADSRLLRGGWTLAYRRAGPGAMALEISAVADDTIVASHPVSEAPQWAGDLPEGENWRQLAAAFGERRLLHRMTIDSTTRRYAVLDDQGKTILRIYLERHSRTDGEGPELRIRIATLKAVRGYEKCERAVSRILADAGLPRHEGCLVNHLGGSAGSGARKPQTSQADRMNRSMPVALAVSRALSLLRNEMISNEAGVRDQLDVEFLHDYRVASRRARSVLNQVRDVLPAKSCESLSVELRWLGTLTGPARDLDVQLGEIHDGADELAGMRQLLLRKRDEAQEALVGALDSHRYKALLDAWERLEDAAAESSGSGVGSRPAGPSIDRHIERAHRRVLRIGKAIDDASPPEALHELRKKTKALRYLLELFGPLYVASELKTAIRELKALQDNLGEFQDTQVQACRVRDLAEEMVQEKSGTASELMAMGRIADSLERRQAAARDEFADRFARFAAPDVTRRYRRMFGAAQGAR